MRSNFEMQMRWTARPANPADLIAARHAIASVQNDDGRIEMTIEREDGAAIRKNVAHDDNTFINTPPKRRRIRHHTVRDAVHRCAKA